MRFGLTRGAGLRVGLGAALVFVLDQLSKWLVVSALRPGAQVGVIPGLFDLTLTYNPGVAFGMMSELSPIIRAALIGLATLAAVTLVLWILVSEYAEDPVGQYAIAMVLGGALGNVVDRLRLGEVIDFVDIYYGTYHWPAFNLADSAICLGVAILLIWRRNSPANGAGGASE